MLKATNIKKYFPLRQGVFRSSREVVKAVDGVSFTLMQGKTFGLVGESGCGKTTVGRCVMGLTVPEVGQITLDGHDVITPQQRKERLFYRRVQIVFQDPFGSLNPRMKVGATIGEGPRLHKTWHREEFEERLREQISLVGLSPDALDRYPHQFSGGQRQRISIARALAVDPDYVVLDEPVSSLDVSIQAQILNLLKDLQQRLGVAYFFVSHDLRVIAYMCDEAAVMYKGKIVERGECKEIYRNPSHPYTECLLAAIPDISKKNASINENQQKPDARELKENDAGCLFYSRCPYAKDQCHIAPELKERTPGHWVACHMK